LAPGRRAERAEKWLNNDAVVTDGRLDQLTALASLDSGPTADRPDPQDRKVLTVIDFNSLRSLRPLRVFA
jgi:hypothetical protein